MNHFKTLSLRPDQIKTLIRIGAVIIAREKYFEIFLPKGLRFFRVVR